jgi:hypothetical protein
MRPEMSWMVAKLALPMTRLSMMRPATLTSTGSLEFLAALLAVELVELAGGVLAQEIVGEGLPAARSFASLARRSAMIWFSSCGFSGVAAVIGASGTDGCVVMVLRRPA